MENASATKVTSGTFNVMKARVWRALNAVDLFCWLPQLEEDFGTLAFHGLDFTQKDS